MKARCEMWSKTSEKMSEKFHDVIRTMRQMKDLEEESRRLFFHNIILHATSTVEEVEGE
jgi:hypothetical protein